MNPPKIHIERNKTLYPHMEYSEIRFINAILLELLTDFDKTSKHPIRIHIPEISIQYHELETDEEYKIRLQKEERKNTARNILKLKLKEKGITKLTNLTDAELNSLLEMRK